MNINKLSTIRYGDSLRSSTVILGEAKDLVRPTIGMPSAICLSTVILSEAKDLVLSST